MKILASTDVTTPPLPHPPTHRWFNVTCVIYTFERNVCRDRRSYFSQDVREDEGGGDVDGMDATGFVGVNGVSGLMKLYCKRICF